jgi:hypothetical protein
MREAENQESVLAILRIKARPPAAITAERPSMGQTLPGSVPCGVVEATGSAGEMTGITDVRAGSGAAERRTTGAKQVNAMKEQRRIRARFTF